MNYWIFILTNPRNLTIIIGLTSQPQGKLVDDSAPGDAGMIKQHDIQKLVYLEAAGDALSAITRETEMKNWRRTRIECLIAATNPNWEAIDVSRFVQNSTR